MPIFRPTRASPLSSPRRHAANKTSNLSTLDTTLSSVNTSASSALAGLTEKDVELIDEIIERSPPTATTFLTVFKAYNEILHERGMDAANDVVYYKLLLKLGVVKGHDWGTKWETVKEQLGYGGVSTPRTSRTAAPVTGGGTRGHSNRPEILRAGRLPPVSSRRPLSSYGRDSLTVHSHQEDATESEDISEQTETETADETEATDDFESSPTTLIQRDRISDTKANALGLSTDTSSYPPLPTIDQFLPVSAKQTQSGYHAISDVSIQTPSESSTPAPRLNAPRPKVPYSGRTFEKREHLLPYTNQSKRPVQSVKDKPLNEEDTWKKIRMIRDEKEADKFREIMLLERCWQVWRGGLDWLKSLNEKVAEQHQRYVLRYALDKWKTHFALRQREYEKIAQRYDIFLLRRFLEAWKRVLKSHKATKWREEMRRKMSLIRENRERMLLSQTWNSWKMAHTGQQLEMRNEQKIMSRIFNIWKQRLVEIDRSEGKADELLHRRERDKTIDIWNHWKHLTELREIGKEISLRVDNRLVRQVLEDWKDKLSEKRAAGTFRDYHIVKNAYAIWKTRQNTLRTLERKADKYQKRRDLVLVSAVFRVWNSRERGVLLERAILLQRLQASWSIWRTRLQNHRILEEYAISFNNRPPVSLAAKALHHWHKQTAIQQRVFANAVQYGDLHLEHRMLMTWRIQLRMKFRQMKQARIARSYLLLRQSWNKWKDALEDKRREQKLHTLDVKMVQRFFIKWHQRAARQRFLQTTLKQLEAKTTARTLRTALDKWTNRIIVLKNRELDVLFRRNGETLQRGFMKWKAVYKRHADDLRLMQSYQYVKREDTMRRMFYRWLSSAKQVRHRRMVLQEREEEARLYALEKAWDTWREKFKAERLKPLERAMTIQLQKNRLYQTFLLWHAKTMSIPAIRFHSITTKAKFWRTWRGAMPKALQARQAREYEQKKLFARALDKWAQAYRTKIALKAVARARYLRLPSGAPRQSLPLSSALSGILKSSHNTSLAHNPRRGRYTGSRSSRASEVDKEEAEVPPLRDPEARTSNSSPVRQQLPLRAVKLAIPKLGGPFHTGEGESSNLWKELRKVRRTPGESS